MQEEIAAKIEGAATIKASPAAANLVGQFFLGKALNGRDYVWGKILAQESQEGEWLAGFFEWKVEVSETDAVRFIVKTDQMTGWQFYPSARDLNDAVAELAHAYFVLDQYKVPNPAKRKRGKTAVKSMEQKDAQPKR
jgi:hypothetical protein